MKILLINNFHYVKGGSEAVYFNMARMFTQAGHEVIFFSCKSDKNTAYGSNYHFVPLNSEVNPILGAFRYIYNGSAARGLERLLRENRPDIAHIHLIWGGLSSSILGVLKRHKIPVVHTAHDFRMICPAYLLRRTDGTICNSCYGGNYLNCAKYRCSNGSFMRSLLMSTEFYLRNHIFHALDSIDGFVFVSRFSYEQHTLAMPKFVERKTLVAHNAIAELKQEAISTEMGNYYLYFGRLSSEKGLVTLISAFNNLPNLKLKIVGSGPMAEQLKSIAGENIEFCGYQSGDTLKQTIRGSKAIVVPSEWYENNPMTIIEASAAGVPTIGARIGGIPEIVPEGKNGYTFTPRSISELTDAITKLESLSIEQYSEMSRNCRLFAEENFSEKALYSKIMNFYTSILESYES